MELLLTAIEGSPRRLVLKSRIKKSGLKESFLHGQKENGSRSFVNARELPLGSLKEPYARWAHSTRAESLS